MRERLDRQRYEEVYAGTYADLVRFVVRRGHPMVRIAGPAVVEGHDDLVATTVDLTQAWARLSAMHQEALSLSV